MKRSSFSEEQIIAVLREQEAGVSTADVCRKHGISSATFYAWKAKFGGMDVSDARRLKGPEEENAKLKRLLAEAMLDNVALKGSSLKKILTPAAKREAVAHLSTTYEMSERRRARSSGRIARWSATDRGGRTMRRYARGCENWPPSSAASQQLRSCP